MLVAKCQSTLVSSKEYVNFKKMFINFRKKVTVALFTTQDNDARSMVIQGSLTDKPNEPKSKV